MDIIYLESSIVCASFVLFRRPREYAVAIVPCSASPVSIHMLMFESFANLTKS